MASSTLFTVLLAAALLATASACKNQCRFKFCYGSSKVKIGQNGVALTGPICKYGKQVGVTNSREALVLRYHSYIPISTWRPHGLKQNFSPSFFKTFWIRYTKMSGVGHEVPQQNQKDFLSHRCFILPIRAYQVLETGKVVDNIHPWNPLHECVAFSTRT